MKIFEIFTQLLDQESSLDFDIRDDLQFFINNDPQFYRKNYFPFVLRLKEAKKKKTRFSAKAFESVVKHAYEVYKNTFGSENLPAELGQELVSEICENLYQTEIKNIEEGHYDDIT